MATIDELCLRGVLERVEADLESGEMPERAMFSFFRATDWMRNDLPSIATDGFVKGALTPEEQAEVLIYDFISGKPLNRMPPKCLQPSGNGIWELRTHDLRFFGWFWRKGVFVLSSVDTKARCKQGLYAGHIEQSISDRSSLELDAPKFISGGIDDVL